MKKTIKITLWVLGGILAFVLLALLTLPLWVGPVVKGVAKSIAPSATGGNLQMEDFSLNPYTGKLRITGFKLENPAGYNEKTAVSFKSLSVDVSVCSLFTKKIHVYDITLEDPFASYVYDTTGSNNFDRIIANVEKKFGPFEKKEEKSETKVLIDRLCIKGALFKCGTPPLPIAGLVSLPSVEMPFCVPVDLEFKDIGKEKPEGTSFKETGKLILKKIADIVPGLNDLLGKIISGDVAKFLGDGLGSAKDKVIDAVGAVLPDSAKDAVDKVKGAGQAASKAVGDVAEKIVPGAAVDTVKDAGKVVGDAADKAAESAKGVLKKINPFGN